MLFDRVRSPVRHVRAPVPQVHPAQMFVWWACTPVTKGTAPELLPLPGSLHSGNGDTEDS